VATMASAAAQIGHRLSRAREIRSHCARMLLYRIFDPPEIEDNSLL
jgi:hypothetical protein